MIETRVTDYTGHLILNRPDALNALNHRGMEQFSQAFDAFDINPDIRTIIITGAGERAFCAGGDISEFLDHHDLEHALYSKMQPLYQRISESRTTTIAAVNGFALGGGFELALACDIRLASENASFALPELGLGVLPAAGGTQRLTRLVGPGRAMDLVLTGRRIDAETALTWGAVTEVTTQRDLLDRAQELAVTIQGKGPIAVTVGRMLVKHADDVSITTGLAMEALAQAVAYGSEDVEEGSRAFSEKRSPNFKGK